MKKILSIILTLVALCSISACGGQKSTTTTTTTVTTEEKAEKPAEVVAEPVAVGNTITLPFAELTVAEAGVQDDIQVSIKNGNITRTTGPDSSADTEFVYIRGTIKNTSTSSISSPDITGKVEINGYSYDIDSLTIIESDGSSTYELAPLVSYQYTLYTEIPNELATTYQTCDINFSFNENFEFIQTSFDGEPELPYNYKLTLTK